MGFWGFGESLVISMKTPVIDRSVSSVIQIQYCNHNCVRLDAPYWSNTVLDFGTWAWQSLEPTEAFLTLDL